MQEPSTNFKVSLLVQSMRVKFQTCSNVLYATQTKINMRVEHSACYTQLFPEQPPWEMTMVSTQQYTSQATVWKPKTVFAASERRKTHRILLSTSNDETNGCNISETIPNTTPNQKNTVHAFSHGPNTPPIHTMLYTPKSVPTQNNATPHHDSQMIILPGTIVIWNSYALKTSTQTAYRTMLFNYIYGNFLK